MTQHGALTLDCILCHLSNLCCWDYDPACAHGEGTYHKNLPAGSYRTYNN